MNREIVTGSSAISLLIQ